jgi:hypothetical protein
MDFINWLLQEWVPHGHCYMWTPDILWANVIGDFGTFLAYVLIPLALLRIVRNIDPNILKPFRWLIYMFAGFIFACGLSHLIDVIAVWSPNVYRVMGFERLLMAAISLTTAYALWSKKMRGVKVNSYLVKGGTVQITEIELPPVHLKNGHKKKSGRKHQ